MAFGAFTPVAAISVRGLGKLILKTHWVDPEEKSRFVTKQFATRIVTKFFSAASTHTAHLLVRYFAAHYGSWTSTLDVKRAFSHAP